MGKRYIWNPATCCCKKGKYLANTIGDSVFTYDEINDEEEIKTNTTNFNEKSKL